MTLFRKSSIYTEAKELLHLALPLASAQVAQAATGFVDIVMMGWLGKETLAAGGLAVTTFTSLLVTLTGIMVGVSPLVATAYGVGNRDRIQKLTQQGIWLCLIISLPMMVLLQHFDLLMIHLGQSVAVVAIAKTYLDIILWGFFPALLFALFKSVMSSLSQTRSIMTIVIGGTIFNAIGNYALGFGQWGFPNLGLAGIAGASALAQWVMVICLLIHITQNPQLKTYQLFRNLHHFAPQVMGELLWIGVPISASFALEVGLFTITTYMMGALGTEILAAHQIVFQTIAVIFMIPLGMSFATTIRVGQWQGLENLVGIKRSAYVSMVLGGGFMMIMAIVLLLFPYSVISLYLDPYNPANAPVVSLVIPMLFVAALAQILDGVQTTAAGALRGLQDTRIPVLLSLASFWGIGVTSGYILGFSLGWGGIGLWMGQLLGIAMAALFFMLRLRQRILLINFSTPERC